MKTPEGKEFAKSVLFHLTGLRAEIYQLRLILAEVWSAQTRRPATEIKDYWDSQTTQTHEALLKAALAELGIEDDPDAGGTNEDLSSN